MNVINKPTCKEAMRLLIEQIREVIPFDIPVSNLCSGICRGCSKKLLDYLDNEIIQWEAALDQDDEIKLGDLSKLASTSRKVFRVLQKNGHIPNDELFE